MEDIAPQTRYILETFVWWGHELIPHPPATTTTTIQTSAKFCDFVACSRLSHSAKDAKVKGTRKVGGAKKGKRKGERASNHFFKDRKRDP